MWNLVVSKYFVACYPYAFHNFKLVKCIQEINRILIYSCHSITVFTLNPLAYRPDGPVSSNIYMPTINSTGPNLKTALMTISSNHQNSKHDDVPNSMWTCICRLRIREDQNASKKTKTLYLGSMFILISWKL